MLFFAVCPSKKTKFQAAFQRLLHKSFGGGSRGWWWRCGHLRLTQRRCSIYNGRLKRWTQLPQPGHGSAAKHAGVKECQLQQPRGDVPVSGQAVQWCVWRFSPDRSRTATLNDNKTAASSNSRKQEKQTNKQGEPEIEIDRGQTKHGQLFMLPTYLRTYFEGTNTKYFCFVRYLNPAPVCLSATTTSISACCPFCFSALIIFVTMLS